MKRRAMLKRLRRILWRGLCLISALLLAATCASWARSHWRNDSASVWNTTAEGDRQNCINLNVCCDAGEVHINLLRGWQTPYPIGRYWPPFPIVGHWGWESGPSLSAAGPAFELLTIQGPLPHDYCDFHQISIAAPHWAFAFCFGILPGFWFYRFRHAMMKRRVGRCRRCGYDLRATPERCPECGTIPAKK